MEDYIAVIKSCFANHAVAKPYYSLLLGYLQRQSHTVSNQSAIEIVPSTHQTSQENGTKLWGTDIPISDVSRTENPCIVLVEGLPSPSSVAELGTKHNVRPEFWLGHLGLDRQSATPEPSFELPNLPSRRDNIVRVTIPIIGRRTGGFSPLNLSTVERQQARERHESWERQILQDNKYGATRIRKIHIHNSRYFSIEQLVSYTVSPKGFNSWNGMEIVRDIRRSNADWVTGLLLIDAGAPITETDQTPWSTYSHNAQSPDFLPILAYNDGPSKYEFPSTHRESSPTTPNSFHPKDHVRVSTNDDLAFLHESPFAVLASILARAASAWVQILNFVESDVNNSKLQTDTSADRLVLALDQQRFNFDFLAHAQRCLEDNIQVIERRGCPNWPGNMAFARGSKPAHLVASLLTDHRFLISRCLELSRKCEAYSGILSDNIKAIETNDNAQQTKQVGRLSKLAIFFVPMGFVSSVFGMNVSSFQNNPPMWTFLAVSLPTTAICFVFLGWPNLLDEILLWMRMKRARSRVDKSQV